MLSTLRHKGSRCGEWRDWDWGLGTGTVTVTATEMQIETEFGTKMPLSVIAHSCERLISETLNMRTQKERGKERRTDNLNSPRNAPVSPSVVYIPQLMLCLLFLFGECCAICWCCCCCCCLVLQVARLVMRSVCCLITLRNVAPHFRYRYNCR